MIVLFSIYFYSLIGVVIEKFSIKNIKEFKIFNKVYLISLLFILTLVTGTRENTGGTDYIAYKIFYNYDMSENPWGYDILFVSLRNIFKFLKLNYNMFLFGISLISHLLIYSLLKKMSNFPLIVIYLFLSNNYFWQNFTILRSSLSIYMFWYFINYLKKNDYLKAFIFWIISCGFHKGAIPLASLFFVLNIKIKKIRFYIISILIAFLISNYLPWILSKVNLKIISPYLDEVLKPVPLGFYLLIFEKILMFGYILFYKKELDDEDYNIYYNLAFLDVILLILVHRIPSFTRYGHYFLIGFYIIIAQILGIRWKKDIKYRVANLLVILYFLLKFISVVNSELYSNYSSWLFSSNGYKEISYENK